VKLNIGKRLPTPGNVLVFASHDSKVASKLDSEVASVVERLNPGVTVIANGEDAISTQFGPATIIEPIVNDGAVVGVLIAANKQGDDCFASSVDIKLLSATATQLGIFIENAVLYEDLNATFLGTLEALTTSIDAKDKYTCGHSQRVALLTAQLAHAYGLDADQVDRFRIAGLVHDIGKIGVPEHVLTKTGGLTEHEIVAIQKHPEIGARILRDIPQMEDILGGVLHHHEKYGGGGYPHGIAGEEIPLVARMISLADTFDAMSSCRTYRNALTRCSVLREMKRVSGAQFDPKLAELFFNLDFSEWERMMIDHQAESSKNLGTVVPITTKDAA
jgi:putative nucleotidyltransferase with HDIG domain